MSFLYPAFLAGASAIAIPIILHLLRRDVAPEVPFSAVRLIRRSPVARSRRRRIRDLILLAARVAALILVAAAFARPFFADASSTSSLRIVALDRSLSMSEPGTFARAVSLANAAVGEAGSGERVAVIAFDDRAEVVAEPGPIAAARSALSRQRVSDGGTRYASMLAKAAELACSDPARLVIVTDLQAAGWDADLHATVPANLTLDVRDAGAPAANAAITGVRVTADQAVATVANDGKAPWKGDVRVERDGRIVATASAVVPPATAIDVPVSYRAPSNGSIAVSIDDPSGFAGDDRRFVVLERTGRSSILIVNSGAKESGYYASRALAAALPDTDVRVVSAATLTPEEAGKHGAILLLSTRGLERRAREAIAAFVRGGGGLFVAGSSEVEPVVLSTSFGWTPAFSATEEPADSVALAATDIRHPILRPFGALTANLGQVRFATTWRVPEAGWQTVARFSDGRAALLERRHGAGRVALFTSDLDRQWNDFPLNAAYVPFVAETVRYVGLRRDARRDFVVGSAPPGVRAEAAGVYDADHRLVAVNVDPRESSIQTMTAAQFTSMIDTVQGFDAAGRDVRARQLEARQGYWQYGLLLMLAALVVESFVGRP